MKKLPAAHELGDERRERVFENCRGGVHLFDLAAVHHRHAVAHGQGFFLVVGDEDEGDAQPRCRCFSSTCISLRSF